MKKYLFLLLFLASASLLHAADTLTVSLLPPLSVGCQQGVSAPFAGIVKGGVLVAGGCNFPGTPAAAGGEKVYYGNAYFLADGAQQWTNAGHLRESKAYGASASLPGGEGVICLGGSDGKKSLSCAFFLRYEGGSVQRIVIPSLPVPLEQAAAAYGGGYIYVGGGQTVHATGEVVPCTSAYRLQWPGGTQWEALPQFPAEETAASKAQTDAKTAATTSATAQTRIAPRLQPSAAVQNGATGPLFVLIGGFSPATERHRGYCHADALVYNPQTDAWTRTAPLPRAAAGAVAAPVGCQHIVVMGGVDKDVFEAAINRPADLAAAHAAGDSAEIARLENEQLSYMQHEPAWYNFSQSLLLYHTITNTWTLRAGHAEFARAGAALVPTGASTWMLVDGESMPGVRTSSVVQVSLQAAPQFGWLNWCVLVAYLIGMLLLGYYFMRRESGADDFFKGGGRIPWWAAGISIYATMLSAITYMAYPAKAFATDWTYYPMLVTILLVSFPVVRYYLPFFRRLNVTTAYEYLERRFNAATRLMASALFIIFMIARMALVLYLPSLALNAVTGIDISLCILLMAVVTIVYCTMGGVEAVVWGDVVQGFILVGGAIFAVGYLICNTSGGAAGFWDIAMTDGKMRLFDWSLSWNSATFWVIIIGGMANNLISYTSDQTVIQRYLTTKDEASARRSILMNGVMSVGVSIAFFAIGAGLYTFYKTHPAALDPTMAKADIIFPYFMMSQLPKGLAGLLIAAIFAATMSTISSNINSVATAYTCDFYRRFRPRAKDHELVQAARYTCIVSGLLGMGIALLMASWEILSLLDFFQEILGLLSSGLGGLFLMGIFFPRIGGKAALVGFLSGVGSVFVVKYCTSASFLLYGAIGMCVSVAVAYALSFLLHEKRPTDGLTWETLQKE